LQTIGHSLKNIGPSQKTRHHPWCPKLVTSLYPTRRDVVRRSRKIWRMQRKSISTAAIGKPERQVRKASHCGSKQQ